MNPKLTRDGLAVYADGFLIATAQTEQGAAFIVRACNAHAPNVARIGEALEMLQGNPSPEAVDTVRAVLAAALDAAKL